jgi:hypothetical protein
MADYDFKPSEETCTRQQQAILERLRRGEVSSIEIREGLGICHPAGRIMELRQQGWMIQTHPGQARDAAGRWHRSAIYRLRQGGAA